MGWDSGVARQIAVDETIQPDVTVFDKLGGPKVRLFSPDDIALCHVLEMYKEIALSRITDAFLYRNRYLIGRMVREVNAVIAANDYLAAADYLGAERMRGLRWWHYERWTIDPRPKLQIALDLGLEFSRPKPITIQQVMALAQESYPGLLRA